MTDHVLIGKANPGLLSASNSELFIGEPQQLSASGSLKVKLQKTTTYRLQAVRRSHSTFKSIEVKVLELPSTAGTCTISGQLTGNLTTSDGETYLYCGTRRNL